MKHVFLVGCPRSGTTWLQLLLAQHPQVATGRETHLFNRYISYLDRSWAQHWSDPDNVGLKTLFTEAEFDALCRGFVMATLDRIAASNPSATVVLEKTPNHVRHGPLILRLVPDAWFIHVVRDPRAVVCSLCAAGRSWARRWASRDVLSNARLWHEDVTLGRQIGRLTHRYREVRYEDLTGDNGPGTLQDLFAWLELPADRDLATRALEECRIARLQKGGEGVRAFSSVQPRDSRQFFRKGSPDAWKEELSPDEIAVVEYAAGDLMTEYGYQPHRSGGRRPLRLALREIIDRLEHRVRSRTEATFERLRAVV